MTEADALSKFLYYFKEKECYEIYTNHEDVYKDIVDTICSRYRGKKEDRVTQWRRRHKRCQFCRHIEYLDNPCGISAYKCRAKEKLVHEWLPRPFCGLYELEIQKKVEK